MRRAGLTLAVLGVLVALAGCGGGARSAGPKTFDNLAGWLEAEGECEGVETEVTRLPVPKSRSEDVAPINLRFTQATVAAVAGCSGLNGYISYYRFPSAALRAAAVRGREGLISNELFCARGPELVVNGLLGYDSTKGFCERLGFEIHGPTHEYSARQSLEHHLEFRAATLVAHVTGAPVVNVECEHSRGDSRKFECEELVGGEITEVELLERGHRYVIKGCEDLGAHRDGQGSVEETCALPTRHR